MSVSRSIRSLEKRVAEHEAKLAAYLKNPDAFDDLGHLQRAGTDKARRQRIIDSRAKHIRQEMANWRKQIQEKRRLLGE